jgi:hypothetical protein
MSEEICYIYIFVEIKMSMFNLRQFVFCDFYLSFSRELAQVSGWRFTHGCIMAGSG